jgi:septal ring factor EnvC (AmiA/AmiB activator)
LAQIAEEVAKVNPALVLPDKDGKPCTVRYEAVNAMLLNEFLKEHKAFVQEQRKVQELEAKDAERQQEIKALIATVKEQAARIQEVSAQLEVSKTAPQTVLNNQ